MIRIMLVGALALVACAPKLHEVRLVNNTPRTIEEVFLFAPGSANHGASRAKLAPNASVAVKFPAGNVEVLAVSEKIKVDETHRETMSASSVIQLKTAVELVFHDSNQPPPPDRPGLHAITFRLSEPPPSPTAPDPEVTPAP